MLQPGRFPTLLSAIAIALLAIWILWLGPRHRLHRAAALFLLLRAGIPGLLSFSDGLTSVWARSVVYLDIALPFAILNFVYLFRLEHGPTGALYRPRARRIVRWSLIGLVLVFELMYVLRHDWYGRLGPSGFFEGGWLSLFSPLKIPLMAFAGVVLARVANRSPTVEQRRALSLFGLGLMAEPAFRAALELTSALRFPDGGLWPFQVALSGLAALLVVLYAVDLVLTRRAGPTPDRFTRRALGLLGLAVASGLLMQLFLVLATPATGLLAFYTLRTLDALWLVVLVVLVAYATIMHRLFDLDLKAKAVVNAGSLAGCIGFILVLTGEGLERVIPINNTGLALVAAVIIAVLLRPLQRVARRLGEAAFPHVRNDPRYYEERRAQIYRAALEGAYRDGEITKTERNLLQGLRTEIGLDARTARALEADVRLTMGLSGELGDAPQAPASSRGGLAKLP